MTDADVNDTSGVWRRADRVAAGLCAGLVLWSNANQLGALDLIRVGPLPLFAALMIGTVLCCVRGWQRAVWTVVALSVGAVIIAGYTPVFETPIKALVRNDSIPTGGVDAIVVLNGGVAPDNLMGPVSLDRLLTGLRLARRGVSRTLIVSEPELRQPGRVSSPAPDVERIAGLVDSVRLIPMIGVHTTRDEAAATREIARSRPIHRIVVVTSPLHTIRACRTFEREGFQVSCVAAETRDVSLATPSSPSGHLELFREWMHERVAMLVGR